MNRDQQFDESFEADVRSALRQTIVPPPTPTYVRYRVEAMDAAALPAPHGPLARWRTFGLPGRSPRFVRRHPAAWRVAAALAVVVVLAGGAALLAQSRRAVTVAAPSTSAPVWSAGAMMLPQLAANGAGFTYVDGTGLFVTADYGETWSGPRQIPAGDSPQGHLWDMDTLEFVDAQRGWMTGVTNDVTGSTVTEYRTLDGGVTWKSVPITAFTEPAGGDSRWVFATEHFTDARNGRLQVGQVASGVQFSTCRQWLTADGGASWTRTADVARCSTTPYWVTTSLGYATAGSLEQTILTRDGGASWQPVTQAGQWSQYRPVMIDPAGGSGITLVAAPGDCQTGATLAVMISQDGGASWAHSYDFTLPGLSAASPCLYDLLSSAGPGRWTVMTDGMLWATQDAGRTWNEVGPIAGADSLAWWDDQRGLLLFSTCSPAPAATDSTPGATDCGESRAFMVTSDGGRTWHRISL